MPIEILMPALSPTMTEGNLSRWVKQEGDKIKPGDVIAEIETDKATMEIEAIDSGILAKILVPAGTESVKVNQLIAIVLEAGEDKSVLDNYNAKAVVTQAITNNEEQKVSEHQEKHHLDVTKSSHDNNRIYASPLAKKIAANEGVDLSNVSGSGPRGRVVKADVLEAISNVVPQKKLPVSVCGDSRASSEYIKIPNNNVRKVIAKRLCESKQTVPHFYLSIECEIDKLLSVRSEMNAAAGNPAKYKLSVNDFVIKAVAMALRDVPNANASWTDEAILQYSNVDISVAVAIDGGIITPIVRNADQKSIGSISNSMKGLATRARAGKLAPEEFQGGGFSISNLGMYGIKNFKAIINPPQSCILAIGSSSERVIVKNSKMEIANIMDVTLSSDHRVVDGAVGAEFLAAFRGYIENPVSMLV